MENSLRLNIYSPERALYRELDVKEVTLPTMEGQIQLLPGHADMGGRLETGYFTFTSSENESPEGVISTGFFEVEGGVVSVMAETLELRSEIDVERASRAQKKAQEQLGRSDIEGREFEKYQLKLERSLIRQQVADKGGNA